MIGNIQDFERLLRFSHFTLENLPESLLWIDAGANIIQVNEQACSLLGYTKEELLAMKVTNIAPHYRERGWSDHWAKLRKEKSITFESQHQRKDGTMITVEITANFIVFEDQEYSCSLVKDISPKVQQRNEQQALLASQGDHQTRLSHFSLQRVPDAVFWIDQEGRIHFANHAACERYGYTEEELIGTPIFALNRNLTPEQFSSLWINLKQSRSHRLESTHFHKDGTEIPVEITMNFQGFEGQEYTCSLVQDLRERKRQQRLLLSVTKGTAHVTGEHFYRSLAFCINEGFGTQYTMVTQFSNHDRTRVKTLAFAEHNTIRENVEYPIEGTPCELVMLGKEFSVPKGLHQQFANQEGLEAFFGVPILNQEGEAIGHIAVFDPKPMEFEPLEMDLLKIFAARAGAEMEREEAVDHLRIALEEVQHLRDRLQAENIYLKQEIAHESNFEEIITQNAAFKQVLGQVEQVAATDATVLILGETGTGKELLARAVHNISARNDRPLVKVNCASLPAQLIESELFGHEKGAFTGALARKTGRFELADKGTIFLDEIGELPLELQAKLLRVLQEGEFERLGSPTTRHIDVRVIAATNRPLQKMVEQGDFRADLYYRLNVFPIINPPLRERKDDISLLVRHFAKKYATKIGRKVEQIPKRVLNMLEAYNWPGNIRELENVVERAVILSMGKNLELTGWMPDEKGNRKVAVLPTMEEAERSHLLKALEHTQWKVSGPNGAAHLLGLKPTTMESRMKKLGIKRQR